MIRREREENRIFIHRKQQVNGILLKPRRILGDNDAPLITYLPTFKREFPWICNKCLQEISRQEVDIGESVYLLRIVM